MSKTLSELMRETAARIMEISPADYKGKIQHPDVEYSAVGKKDEVDKVIAVLRGGKSAEYTRMGTNFNKIKQLEAEIANLREEMDADLRAAVAGVFNPEDAVYTRVIETASFVFEISKDPKAAETVQYSKVLAELATQLTPDLVTALEVIKAKYTTQQKAKPAAIKSVTDKRVKPKEESIQEGVLEEGWIEQFKAAWTGFVNKVKGWCSRYDQRLAALKAQVGVHESAEEEIALEDVAVFEEPAVPSFEEQFLAAMTESKDEEEDLDEGKKEMPAFLKKKKDEEKVDESKSEDDEEEVNESKDEEEEEVKEAKCEDDDKEEVDEAKEEDEEKELEEAINNLFRVTAVLNKRFAK